MEIIEKALKEGRMTLSEFESKQVLALYGVPITKEVLVDDINQFSKSAQEIGYPLVLKGCSAEIGHKTESDLLHVDIRNEEEGVKAFEEIISKLNGRSGAVLVQEMIKGSRELVIGATRDPQFGPCVMFGLGGIFTEILKDVSFRIAPLEKRDALEMMKEIKGRKILEDIRGMEPADLDILSEILINVGRFALENDRVKEVDINPVILSGNKPIAVDALIVLE
ncbi:MAG: acetate--CoA ligase family protein [Desulfatiglans sp.]|nr:acetate--CoA ligase family protein [Thermodesulfobacteriota bacterium]MEE4354082.1 acetate--CoA ligase family protein [Desulfatiglans sp.]